MFHVSSFDAPRFYIRIAARIFNSNRSIRFEKIFVNKRLRYSYESSVSRTPSDISRRVRPILSIDVPRVLALGGLPIMGWQCGRGDKVFPRMMR